MALKFRRGTTAQQSGSLAFGEPFVNTTLGTLLVGGPNGDIVLSAGGTGSTGTFGAISGSGLDITGNANIAGNLTLGGNITIGDATTDTVSINADLSSSIIPDVTNTFDLGSTTKVYRNVYATSISGAIAATNGVVSGSSQVIGILSSLNTFSGSQLTQNTALATITGSLILSASAAAVSISNLNTFSGSQLTRNTALATITGSLILSASAHNGRLSAIETVSGTFARTNSTNTFNGNQIVSGSLTVTQDFTVLGSSSIQNISSSTLNIGTNLITVAVNQPSVRFGGLAVIDSGSAGGSGSFLYDSVHDEFIFVHRGNGTNVTSSHFVLGPETYDNLGNETYLTNNRLVKGTGKEHIVDSNIFDDGTTISLGSNVAVTGSITISGTVDGVDISVFNSNVNSTTASLLIETANLESFSSSALTRLSALEVETANLETFSSSALTRLTALEVETLNLESFTSSINTTIKTRLNAETVVSGSSQITATSTTGFATGVKTQLDANTVVSGSSQINVASTTGDIALGTRTSGNYVATITGGTGVSSNGATTGEGIAHTISIGQAVATSDNVRFNSLGIGMAATGTAGRIDAANDVVAFSSSDIRFKENIKPIENAIDKIRKISGNTYDWKEENKVEHGYEGNDVGVIAQEIEAVLPQLVQTRESGFKAVKYDKLVALLIEGIKEQQLQIEQLRIDLNNCRNNKGL